MAGTVNKVILVGHLGRDPEIRRAQSGDRFGTLRVATSESWRDKQTGERVEKTEWHTVAIRNDRVAEVAEKYLRKGSKVYIEGQLETRKWTDKEGAERYSTEVVIGRFRGELTLLDKISDERGGRDDDHGSSRDAGGAGASSQRSAPAGRAPDLDDDIPF